MTPWTREEKGEGGEGRRRGGFKCLNAVDMILGARETERQRDIE